MLVRQFTDIIIEIHIFNLHLMVKMLTQDCAIFCPSGPEDRPIHIGKRTDQDRQTHMEDKKQTSDGHGEFIFLMLSYFLTLIRHHRDIIIEL